MITFELYLRRIFLGLRGCGGSSDGKLDLAVSPASRDRGFAAGNQVGVGRHLLEQVTLSGAAQILL